MCARETTAASHRTALYLRLNRRVLGRWIRLNVLPLVVLGETSLAEVRFALAAELRLEDNALANEAKLLHGESLLVNDSRFRYSYSCVQCK